MPVSPEVAANIEYLKREAAAKAGDPLPMSVVVTDIDMPFWSMVLFMVKWALASIPAVVILATCSALLVPIILAFVRR